MTAPTATRVQSPWAEVIPHLLWLVPLIALTVPTATFLWHEWTKTVYTNGHGMMVPVLVGVLAWQTLSRHPAREEPNPWGFAILIPALLIIALDTAIHTQLLAVFGLLLALPGISLLLLGTERSKALFFPWLLTFFMMPIPNAFVAPIHLVLREVTITGVGWFLHAIQLPVLIEGFYIYQPSGVLWVANECSGFSTLYASVTVALVLCFLSESWKSRLLLIALCAPFALGANILRVSLLALVVNLPNGRALLDGPLHQASGWMTFMVAFACLYLVADMRRWSHDEWDSHPGASSPTSPS
ncbi:MAG: exosortase/archaeosortase family protein [Myxococcota bacterium]|nr:exosortase/archaeosortase family protein [Myxococcota bacterium]